MTVMFSGGAVMNGNDVSSPIWTIRNDQARVAAWRDFLLGLTPAEQLLFNLAEMPGGRGRLVLSIPQGTTAWAAVQANPTTSGVHEHVRHLMRATADPGRTFHVLAMPVFQIMPPQLHWVTEVATRNNPSRASHAISVNGYGTFPREWLGFEVAGRTHRAVRRPIDDACVYATRFIPNMVAPEVTATWNVPTNRSVQVTRLPGDTVQRWVDREGCVTLFHELIHHAIRGVSGHAGPFDEWVERRARNNWNAANP